MNNVGDLILAVDRFIGKGAEEMMQHRLRSPFAYPIPSCSLLDTISSPDKRKSILLNQISEKNILWLHEVQNCKMSCRYHFSTEWTSFRTYCYKCHATMCSESTWYSSAITQEIWMIPFQNNILHQWIVFRMICADCVKKN